VVEHARRRQQLGRERQRAAGIAGQQDARRRRRRRVQVDRGRALGQAAIIAVCDAVAMAASLFERVRDGGLVAPSDRVLALVSAGRDSVCLLDVLGQVCGPERIVALHVDYGLRGEESDGDARAVTERCEALGVRCIIVRAPAPPRRGNLQAWARDLRYGLALEHAQGALIATGHTASDQAETVLYRLAASPGRRALLGIALREGRLVRPLLAVTREETAAWCRERALPWREDSSNAGARFARGRVRHGVLAELRTIHPAAEENVVRTAEILRAEADVLDEVVGVALAGRARIATDRLAALPPALARLVTIRLAEDAAGTAVAGVGGRVDELLALGYRGGSAALDVGAGVRAIVEYGVLRFARVSETAVPAPVALPLPGAVAFGEWRLRCAVEPVGAQTLARTSGSRRVGVLDAERLGVAALTVRAWRTGDRMRPLGLHGSKAVSDLLRDRRVPRAERATLPLLVREDEIAWIPGVATAERFRVDGDTQRVVVVRASHAVDSRPDGRPDAGGDARRGRGAPAPRSRAGRADLA
jgi:tRNA(Ile)-lysidine synthase